MQRRRLSRRRSALLSLCASDSPVPHTKGLPFPTFCRLSALGPPPSRLPGLRGPPGPIPRATRPLGHPPLPRKTSPNFPQTRRAGRDPSRRRACAPPAALRSQGSGELGWSRTRIPRGPPSPCYRGSRGSGAVCLLSRLKVAVRHRALRSPAIFAHGSLQEGLQEAASREGAERPEGGQEMGPKASFGETRGNNAPGRAGSPRMAACRGSRGPGRRLR